MLDHSTPPAADHVKRLGVQLRGDDAADEYRRGAALFQSCGASFNEAMALHHHGVALRELGEPVAAAELLRRALTLFSTVSSPWWEAQTLDVLASVAETGDSGGAGPAGDATGPGVCGQGQVQVVPLRVNAAGVAGEPRR